MATDGLTMLERVRIGVQASIPIVRAFEAELGKERVAEILAGIHRRAEEEAERADAPEPDFSALVEGFAFFAQGDALDYEVRDVSEEGVAVDVVGCRYAAMMEELGARDLGPHLICNGDFAMALRGGARLTRTQTCMQGASHCDFRYTKR